jgi:hypothetical protein
MRLFVILISCTVVLAIAGCTTVDANKIDSQKYAITEICIEENPAVPIDDLLPFLVRDIQARNIKTLVYHGKRPEHCEFSLWYTASHKRDFGYYMDRAVLRLKRNEETIASATYKHGGGLALNKWGSAEYKMKPVMDELFADFSSSRKPSDN